MATIAWNESSPADADSAGGGDDAIRSLKTSIRVGLATEHVWPSAGGDAGVHLPGSARAYFGTQSRVSSAGTDGRVMWTSDTSNFFHVGSGGTAFIGGAKAISHVSFPGFAPPQTVAWVEDSGAQLNSGGLETITFNAAFNGVPHVTVSAESAGLPSTRAIGLTITNLSATQAIVNPVLIQTASVAQLTTASVFTLHWRSIGTVTIGAVHP